MYHLLRSKQFNAASLVHHVKNIPKATRHFPWLFTASDTCQSWYPENSPWTFLYFSHV